MKHLSFFHEQNVFYDELPQPLKDEAHDELPNGDIRVESLVRPYELQVNSLMDLVKLLNTNEYMGGLKGLVKEAS